MSDVESEPVEFLAGDLPSPEVEMATLGANVGPAADMAIEDINPANPHLFKNDCWQDHFARLRAKDPVHLNELETSGRYWSLTKYDDVRATDGNWETFSCRWHQPGAPSGPGQRRAAGTAADLHRDGSAEAHRAAQDRARRVGAEQPAQPRADDP